MTEGIEPRATDAWKAEALPVAQTLSAVGSRFHVSRNSAPATVAAFDELKSVAERARAWYLDHPCPIPSAGRHFLGMVDAYRTMADLTLDNLTRLRDPEMDSNDVWNALLSSYEAAKYHASGLRVIVEDPPRQRPLNNPRGKVGIDSQESPVRSIGHLSRPIPYSESHPLRHP